MHELGLTQEVVEIVSDRAGGRKVGRIILEVGRLSCVLPEAMQFCFGACSEGTVAEGATLEIVRTPGRGRCRRCGGEVAMEHPLTRCSCGSGELDWQQGDEIRIQALELI
jgi:hydrogenase nickel incorporation protein HypA/HybF